MRQLAQLLRDESANPSHLVGLEGLAVLAALAQDFPGRGVALGAIFVSLELSKSTWLITSLAPGSEKMSRHSVAGGDIASFFSWFVELRRKAQVREGRLYPLVVIQEAGLDGFWINRVLNREDWIESHFVDAASIAVSRRHWRAKTDRIDGGAQIRALIA